MKLKKYEKNPILYPNPVNDWESLVVCNPGVWYENGIFYMLYRAAGNDAEHVIRLGLAISKNG
ncbi:MAG TPA: glycosidase, partial [Dysgonomonas sp.]|nr:glycosidase [Dysgonomonas sp.]